MRHHRAIIFFKFSGPRKTIMWALWKNIHEQFKFLCAFGYNILSNADVDRTQNTYFKYIKYIKPKFIQIILPSNLNHSTVNKHFGKHNKINGSGAC